MNHLSDKTDALHESMASRATDGKPEGITMYFNIIQERIETNKYQGRK